MWRRYINYVNADYEWKFQTNQLKYQTIILFLIEIRLIESKMKNKIKIKNCNNLKKTKFCFIAGLVVAFFF